ncbi:MAG: hypothetical protein M3178_18000 [Pseudomonadota bacterium]|nr:hypothetical protein [Pseudomonadota bacterium]
MPTIKTRTADGSPSPRLSIEPAQGIGFIREYPLPHERVALEHVLKRLCVSTQIAIGLAERKVETDLDLQVHAPGPPSSAHHEAVADDGGILFSRAQDSGRECRMVGRIGKALRL